MTRYRGAGGAKKLDFPSMKAFVIGVNHRTAPVALRGGLAFAPQQSADGLARLRAAFPAQGFVLLSTCNRTELYGTLAEDGASPRRCLDLLLEHREYDRQERDASLYECQDMEAIRHLFRVTAALDSMLVGEDQILGQVKSAHEEARNLHATNLFLDVLFRHAITAGKRVKSETGISRNSLSLGSLAVRAAAQVLGDLHNQPALVVGSGKMGSLALRNLRQAGASPLYVTVRTKHGPGKSLADEFPELCTVDYNKRHELYDRCSIIVSATQCPHFTIKREDLRQFLTGNQTRVLLDLAVPRDIDPAVADLPGCAYFDLDQLQKVAAENHDLRKAEIQQAEAILAEELMEFERWWTHRKAMPTLKRLRVNLRRRYANAEKAMLLRMAPSSPQELGKAYSQLAAEFFDVVFFRLREHCSPEELEILYQSLNRAFRKW